jgi:hypothetical protein
LEKSSELEQLDPWSLYIYAMKAPMTRDRYQTRLAKFLTFIGVAGKTLQEQSRAFGKKGKYDSIRALNGILKFVQFQKDRVDKKEISGPTACYLSSSSVKFWQFFENLSSLQVVLILQPL